MDFPINVVYHDPRRLLQLVRSEPSEATLYRRHLFPERRNVLG
jgi:hypothetical protein